MITHDVSFSFSYIAEVCGYENPHNYTGHSMRRFSTTVMADAGATSAQLRNKLNHTSEKGKKIKYLLKKMIVYRSIGVYEKGFHRLMF